MPLSPAVRCFLPPNSDISFIIVFFVQISISKGEGVANVNVFAHPAGIGGSVIEWQRRQNMILAVFRNDG
jgi:hypothetical protein